MNNISEETVIIKDRTIFKFAWWLLLFLGLIAYFPFLLLWGSKILKLGFHMFLNRMWLIIVLMVIFHEGLHGLFWMFFTSKGFRAISFGFNKEMLSPYTHCNEPLKKYQYILGGAAPLVILGLIPFFFGLVAGNAFWLLAGAINIWCSAGDILSCYYILRYPSNCLFLDHPDKPGFIVIYPDFSFDKEIKK